ncbi:hypothetical protein P4637_18220 [Halalkalibacterium halodurans]|nr:hypothetical protein [Halalkalibacterium halodurans]MED4080850.1 hypothetical protein [Halalkalibacterium halodurans]MED4086751.1 hypothetical protein [Halalkalibacterium halodurans]MED4107182.1 hypothetical protein [Halalkalibacterium halodurans]MED4111212.1 hypothetical protein [Halalkalibacterium halodurans]MED4126478.1 hypothetical protein [Halalkalibacterium halodurans]
MTKKLCIAFMFSLLLLMLTPISSLASDDYFDDLMLDDPFLEVDEFEIFYDEEYENSNELLDPNTISNDVGIMGGGNCTRTYPGTGVCALPGDILYTSKSLDTAFVGHVGMINTSSNIAHVIPAGFRNGDSFSDWRNRFGSGQTTVYRYNNVGRAYSAATQVPELRNAFSRYRIGTNRYDKKNSYCSKMIWQAYDGAGVTLRGWTNSGLIEAIPPRNLVNQSYFKRVATS